MVVVICAGTVGSLPTWLTVTSPAAAVRCACPVRLLCDRDMTSLQKVALCAHCQCQFISEAAVAALRRTAVAMADGSRCEATLVSVSDIQRVGVGSGKLAIS